MQASCRECNEWIWTNSFNDGHLVWCRKLKIYSCVDGVFMSIYSWQCRDGIAM